jgi:hypothetical protein
VAKKEAEEKEVARLAAVAKKEAEEKEVARLAAVAKKEAEEKEVARLAAVAKKEAEEKVAEEKIAARAQAEEIAKAKWEAEIAASNVQEEDLGSGSVAVSTPISVRQLLINKKKISAEDDLSSARVVSASVGAVETEDLPPRTARSFQKAEQSKDMDIFDTILQASMETEMAGKAAKVLFALRIMPFILLSFDGSGFSIFNHSCRCLIDLHCLLRIRYRILCATSHLTIFLSLSLYLYISPPPSL